MTNVLSRRRWLQFSSAGVAAWIVDPTNVGSAAAIDDVEWHDVRDWGIEGRGWPASEMETFYDRLPRRAIGVVPPSVWGLSQHSAGMLTRFRSDASAIWVDYGLRSPRLAMPHMPATGVSGVDLYATDDAGQWRWLSVTRPIKQETTARWIESLPPKPHEFTAYLPLYNGIDSLRIGVPGGASFEPIAPRDEKPIVFYGTSITHGACASRPGMPHPAILGRRLNRPVINLGFSGNGRMEAEVGQFLAEIDAAVFVIDCLPNMRAAEITERAEPLVRILHSARPDTPILLVEDRTYAHAPFVPALQERHRASREALHEAYRSLRDAGIDRLSYLNGESLLGDDRDDTTDGSHPNDLGFFRHANAFEPVLRELLNSSM